jgi:2-amino-4-hydroxy-6-hydroxymethyldihydropteridine diphosphokinase
MVCQTSSILKNPPFGYLNQAFFYNAVMVLQTNLLPRQLLRHLQKIEKRFRRKRSFKDAPRTLDLDILFYDTLAIETDELSIPHKEWYKRESVLIPLMEVNI